MARIVVLGGTGFVGRHTLAAAIAAGHTVQAVTRSHAGIVVVTELGVTPIPGAAGR